jgi:hypothetical protein
MPYPIGFPVALDRRIDALLPGSTPAGGRSSPPRRAQLATPAPPPPPGRPAQPAVAPVMHRPPRKPGERVAPPREAPREPQQASPDWHGDSLRVTASGEREQGRGGDGDDSDGTDIATGAAGETAADGELDSHLVATLLDQSRESGMFEVLLPGGETLGVAVDVRAEAVDYLLTPPSAGLAAQLRGRQMELAGQLGQRIGRSVRITVL